VRQILTNLLGNALKFTSKGRVALSVALAGSIGEEATLTFRVEDTGSGIPKEDLERIFHPFEQVLAPPSEWGTGTGLGLAISRQLAKLMGGSLTAESTGEAGSAFTFQATFQLCPDSAEAPLGRAESPVAPGETVSKREILFVDDSPDNRKLVALQLEHLGYQSRLLKDGTELLEMSKEALDEISVVLLDCQMPTMDGLEVARRFRRLSYSDRRYIPIVAVTANAMPRHRQVCLEAGMDDYLSKPYSLEELSRILATWIEPAEDPG
jgi:CheY-like chemotaxis protein